MTTYQRWFNFSNAFDHSVTTGIVAAIVVGLVFASIAVRVLRSRSKISPETFGELLARTRSWYVLSAAMVLPILLGAAWVWLFFLLLSLFCYREFAKATKLTESSVAYLSVYLPIATTFFAALDHWPAFFTASWILGICWIAVAGLVVDRPEGYLHRTSLALIGYALFGISMGHMAFFANDVLYRPILLWILVFVELNDIFAYLSGKTFGRRKLLPNTSPNKTIAGAVGAIAITTALSATVGHFIFAGTPVGNWPCLIVAGLILSVLGQCGDLIISSIKRDIGVKDMASFIPGHGGLLDRFDSLLIVSPVIFHFINYFQIVGKGQATQVLSGFLAQ